ncbi:MAG: hypothetical protein HOG79_11125, partial [Prolixibacteraceae bacterium]|nr:hypothetical protein [Prolixibacteraceae bacterium]
MPEKQSKLSKFWQELKRRKVVRVIIVYATTAFILLQLISILIEPLHLPQWVMTLVIVLLGIGFPIAVIFSWIFDVTPTGIEVTHSTKEKNISPKIGLFRKKYLVFDIIIGILIIVVIILAYPKLFKGDTASKIDPELEKSIAVLPFINDSNDSTKVYVINGLMESILTNLQKIKDLRVIS